MWQAVAEAAAQIGKEVAKHLAKEVVKELVEDAAEQVKKQVVKELVKEVTAAASGLQVQLSVQLDMANLKRLKGKSRQAVFRAVNRAAKPVKEAVIANAGRIRRFGFLEKSIGTKTKMKKGGIFTVIGPKMSFRRKKQGKKLGTIVGDQGRDTKGRFTAKATFEVRNKTREFVPYKYAWILEYALGGRFKFLDPALKKSGQKFKDAVCREIATELKKVNNAE